MLRIREYRRVESLEEAYELNQKKTNRIIGGGLWMKIGDRNLMTAIDLSGLGLDQISETEDEFVIGCMATLRDLEVHPGLNAYTDGAVKQNSVNSLISSTQANISQTNSELSSAQGKVNDINSQIARMEELEKQLEIQKAKEDAARMAEIKRQEAENNGEFSYVPSDSDLYLLGAIIQCEADGEPYEGKLAVGSVVMNRVRSSYFPNTVSGVIYQSGQFSPVASGRYALRLEQGVNNTCMQAAQEVLNGNITNSCLYFRTVIDGLEGTIIGHHIFY